MGKPTIRFEGYTDDWEQRKFGDLVEKYEDPVKTPTEGYMRLGIRSHAKGTFHSYVEKGKELETAKMFRVAADKFIVNITFGWEHAVAITDEDDAGKLVSHRFPQYSFNNGILPKFFRYLILDEKFKHHLELSSPGGAGRNRVLKLSDMLEYKMNFPCEEEQRKIAVYFDDLDHLITLHQRKCEETKKLKKFMLQKMFPQKGEKVPKIRFDGFTDDWEQRKLSEISDVRDGTHDSPSYLNDGHPFVTSKNVKDGYINYDDIKYISDEDFEAINKRSKVDVNDILMGMIGTIGNLALIRTEPDFAIKNVALIKDTKQVSYMYLYHYLQSSSTERQLLSGLDGGTQKFVSLKNIRELNIMVPSEAEQLKVGNFIESLDHLITLHQRKCEELQNIKKFMLQNMFV